MEFLFYFHASVAVLLMGLAMFSAHAVHALLSAVLSLISIAVALYALSAPLAAALEMIVYAGAIMVLFVFVVMLLQVPVDQKHNVKMKQSRISLSTIVFFVFLGQLAFSLKQGLPQALAGSHSMLEVAVALFGTYGLLVELISFVLLAGLIAAIFVGESFINENRRLRSGHDSA